MHFSSRNLPIDRRFPRGHGGLGLLLAASALWSGAAFLPSIFHLLGMHPLPGMVVHACYSPLCHQIPERTLFLAGVPMAVCARCAAIYLAFTAAVAFACLRPGATVLRRLSPLILLWLLVPMLADVASDAARIWHSTYSSRMLTGAVAGCALGLFAADGWRRAWDEFRSRTPATLTHGGST